MSSNEKSSEPSTSRYGKISSSKDIVSVVASELSDLEKYFSSSRIIDENDAELIESINIWLSNDDFYYEFILRPVWQAAMDNTEAGSEVLRRDWTKILIRELLGGESQPFLKPGLKLLSEAISATLKTPTLAVWKKREEARALSEDEIRSRVTDLSPGLRERTKLEMKDVMPRWLRPTSGNSSPSQMLEEHQMARQSNDRERDENGRFVSDDDRGSSRQASSSSRDDRRRTDDDEDRRGWYGDSAGHAEAARRGWEDRERSSNYGRSSNESRGYARQDRDDDRRYSRGSDDDRRSHGGWFGDSRGHSQAARQGWDERDDGRRESPSHYREDDRSGYRQRDDEGRFTSGSSRSHYNDDDRRSSGRSRDEEGRFSSGYSDERGTRSRYDDDSRGSQSRSRDEEGRFTSDSRYSNDDRRSSSRDDDDNRGSQSRGRDEEGRFTSDNRYSNDDRRSSSRDDDDNRRYSSRSRDEDDDGRSGNPGWSGDPRGHAEAARKGWENRRR
jgi:hypothetical protein